MAGQSEAHSEYRVAVGAVLSLHRSRKGQIGGYVAGAHSTRFPSRRPDSSSPGIRVFPAVECTTTSATSRLVLARIRSSNRIASHRNPWRPGLFYIQPFMVLWNNFVQNAPFSPSATLNGVNFSDPYGSAGQQNPFPPSPHSDLTARQRS